MGGKPSCENPKDGEKDISRKKIKGKPNPYSGPIHVEFPTHRGLYDYVARDDDQVTFRAGDTFIVIEKSNEWMRVKCTRTKESGLAPTNYITPINNHESERWFAGCVGRYEANRRLLRATNNKGTFLIRESQQNKGDFTLCVLDHNLHEGRTVKAYLIRRSPAEGMYFIYEGVEFHTLTDLVNYYSKTPDGICCQLMEPCSTTPEPSKPRIPKNIFEVSRESITFLEPIGKGSFGEVWKGKWNGTIDVAIKQLTPGKMAPLAFIEEANIMRHLKHQNLLQLQAVVSEEPILIVTEYMSLGNLHHYLRKGAGRKSTQADHYDMAAQIAAGLAYTEKNNFIHRDIRACNVLVGENCVYKVSDFGLSRILEDDIYNAAMDSQFPVKWTAPEGLTYMSFSIKSDVWSFGILLTEIVTKGGIPYPGMTNPDVEPALNAGYRMPRPPKCDEDMYRIMRQCWEQEPEDRPTFQSLKEYFEDRTGAYNYIEPQKQ